MDVASTVSTFENSINILFEDHRVSCLCFECLKLSIWLPSRFDNIPHLHLRRMKCIYKHISCLFLLSSRQLGIAARLSTPLPTVDASPVRVFNASLTGPNDLQYRPLQLSIDQIGEEIPEDEVVETLKDADHAIRDQVTAHPNQRIYNNQFEYRREGGDMLLIISAFSGEEITWSELQRLIFAIYRYMTGGQGHPEEHLNTLEFRILNASHTVIGSGLVWYFPSETTIQKRDSLSSGNTIERDHRERRFTPAQTNTTVSDGKAAEVQQEGLGHPLALSNHPEIEMRTSSPTVAELNTTAFNTHIPIPLPGTPLTLIVTSLGIPIPNVDVGAGLSSALRQIRPNVRDHAQAMVDNDQYWYRNKVSHLWLIIMASPHKVITWEYVNWTMAGLLLWMKGDHSREISFELEIDGRGYIGSGSVGYDPLRISQSVDNKIH